MLETLLLIGLLGVTRFDGEVPAAHDAVFFEGAGSRRRREPFQCAEHGDTDEGALTELVMKSCSPADE